jgi:hypothetical protein
MPVLSGIQPMGLPGDPPVINLRVPPYCFAAVVGAAEVWLEVVSGGLTDVVVEEVAAGVVVVADELQPTATDRQTNITTRIINTFFTFSSYCFSWIQVILTLKNHIPDHLLNQAFSVSQYRIFFPIPES